MLISKERLGDVRHRQDVLDKMLVAITLFEETGDPTYWNRAEWLGKESVRMKELIETTDYNAVEAKRREHFINNPHKCEIYE